MIECNLEKKSIVWKIDSECFRSLSESFNDKIASNWLHLSFNFNGFAFSNAKTMQKRIKQEQARHKQEKARTSKARRQNHKTFSTNLNNEKY